MKPEETTFLMDQRPWLPSPGEVGGILRRGRRAMMAAFVLICLLVGISGIWRPQYQAEMKIFVSRLRSDGVVTPSADSPVQLTDDSVSEEDLNSEIELLNSEDLLRSVVLSTGLASKSDAHPSDYQIASAVRTLAKNLKIEAVRKTDVISVKYTNSDPRMAAAVLRAMSAAYTEKHIAIHRSAAEFPFFDQEAARYQRQLEHVQKQLTDFTAQSGVVSADAQRDAALQQASQFDATAHDAQSAADGDLQKIRDLNEQLQTVQPRLTTTSRTSDNPQLLEQMKSTLLTLQLKRTDLLTKFDPGYRTVKEVDQQIADTQSAINKETGNPIREQTTDDNPAYLWLQSELVKTQADLTAQKARAISSAATAAQYRETARRLDGEGITQDELLRQEKVQEDNYMLFTRKSEEASISNAMDQRGILNVAVAEQPVVPALPVMSMGYFAFLTLILASIMSLITAFILDFANPVVRTADDVTAYLGAPVLAALSSSGD